MNPPPGCFVTVMRPGTALCSPCSFYTSSPPSPFLSSCHLHSHFVIPSQRPSSSVHIVPYWESLCVLLSSIFMSPPPSSPSLYLSLFFNLFVITKFLHIYYFGHYQDILLKRKINKYITTGFKHWFQHFSLLCQCYTRMQEPLSCILV